MDEAKLKDLAERYIIAENGDRSRCGRCAGTIPHDEGEYPVSTIESGSYNCQWEGGQYGRYNSHYRGLITDELGDPEEIIELIIEEIRGK